MILVRRVYAGITDHLPIRRMEWLMLWPSLGMWFVLQLAPDMFDTSRSFAKLSSWADESTWSLLIAVAALCRLLALTINGTFKQFTLSPHLRALASLVGVMIWSQISLGFLIAAMVDGGAYSPVVAWSTMAIAEILNVFQAWADVAKAAHRQK